VAPRKYDAATDVANTIATPAMTSATVAGQAAERPEVFMQPGSPPLGGSLPDFEAASAVGRQEHSPTTTKTNRAVTFAVLAERWHAVVASL
jgi:hypothetical protein